MGHFMDYQEIEGHAVRQRPDPVAELRREVAALREEIKRLRRELEKANNPTWPRCDDRRARNSLETISHWWCPDPSRSMRINY